MKKFCNQFVKIIYNNQFLMKNNQRFDFKHLIYAKKFYHVVKLFIFNKVCNKII